jgi:WD40 repeat protein
MILTRRVVLSLMIFVFICLITSCNLVYETHITTPELIRNQITPTIEYTPATSHVDALLPTRTPQTELVPTLITTQIHFSDQPFSTGAMVFSPTDEVFYLASANGLIRIQGNLVQILQSWPEKISDQLARFSSNNSVLAVRLAKGNIRLINLSKAEIIRDIEIGNDFDGWPTSLALSTDGAMLALAANENTVQIWNVNDGTLITTLNQPGSGITYQELTFSPDNQYIVGGFMNTVTFWTISTRESVVSEPGCRGDTIFDLSYSPNGQWLAIACGSTGDPVGFLIVLDPIKNEAVWRREEIAQMQLATFSTDSNWLATGSASGTIMIWDSGGKEEPISITQVDTTIENLIFTPDGKYLAFTTKGELILLPYMETLHP